MLPQNNVRTANPFSQNSIHAVLFDLDGTLRHNRPSAHETIFKLAIQFGVPDSPEKRREASRWAHRYWAQSDNLFADLKKFVDDDKNFWINYVTRELQAFGCAPEEAADLAPKFRKYMTDDYQPENWIPPDVTETLQTLKRAGFVVGLVSNRRKPVQDELAELGLLPLLDFAFVAGEINVWKPNPEIFYHALKQADSDPEHTVYVGDNYYTDIIGAQNAGLHPVLIDPDDVFPDAECTVIRALGELLGILL